MKNVINIIGNAKNKYLSVYLIDKYFIFVEHDNSDFKNILSWNVVLANKTCLDNTELRRSYDNYNFASKEINYDYHNDDSIPLIKSNITKYDSNFNLLIKNGYLIKHPFTCLYLSFNKNSKTHQLILQYENLYINFYEEQNTLVPKLNFEVLSNIEHVIKEDSDSSCCKIIINNINN